MADASTLVIDTSAARITVWLYLLPTAAAFVVTLMRGEPNTAATTGGGSLQTVAVTAAPTATATAAPTTTTRF